jgi:hypothetical protein
MTARTPEGNARMVTLWEAEKIQPSVSGFGV